MYQWFFGVKRRVACDRLGVFSFVSSAVGWAGRFFVSEETPAAMGSSSSKLRKYMHNGDEFAAMQVCSSKRLSEVMNSVFCFTWLT